MAPIDPTGSAFNDDVYVWTEDMFNSLPTTAGASFALKAGTKAQWLFVDARYTSPEMYTTQPDATSYPAMKATGTIKTAAGTELKFDKSDIQWTDVRHYTVDGGPLTIGEKPVPYINWVAKATDATGKTFFVSNHGMHSGEKYTMVDPGPNILDGSPLPAFVPKPNDGMSPLSNVDNGWRIDGAVTPKSPLYLVKTPGKDPDVYQTDLSILQDRKMLAYEWADIQTTSNGVDLGGQVGVGLTFQLKPNFTRGSFISYDNDNYISDGYPTYSDWHGDGNQLGKYTDASGKVIFDLVNYQSETGFVLQHPDGHYIKATTISFGATQTPRQILFATEELDPKVVYQQVQIDGTPGFVNPTDQIELSFKYEDLNVCFVTGSLIKTKDGSKPVEELVTGDLVWTKDDGYQPIRWIGKSEVSSERLAQNENLRPIRIGVNTLGENMPSADLLVSRQHRMVMQSKLAMKFHGVDTVLVAAKDLLDLDGVEVVQTNEPVEYFHILFDKHQIIEANGCASESFYPGPRAVNSIDKDVRDELVALFPELANPEALVFEPAAQIVDGGKARKLVRLHAEKGLALQN